MNLLQQGYEIKRKNSVSKEDSVL